jgi:tripartite ATP-independent transporter DctM subunit
MSYFFPNSVASPETFSQSVETENRLSKRELFYKSVPIITLIVVVLGGIYAGLYTPTEAGAAGAFVAFLFALWRRSLSWRGLWEILVETGHITATLLFLIVSASMYSRMLGITGLPTQLGTWIGEMNASFGMLLFLYVVIVLVLGTIIDSVSIMLISVPLFLVVLAPYNVDLVWFGIVTIIATEIGLLTPPLGLAVYVIKSTLDRDDISLADIFIGAAPFALTMLFVLIAIILVPEISLYLVELRRSLI